MSLEDSADEYDYGRHLKEMSHDGVFVGTDGIARKQLSTGNSSDTSLDLEVGLIVELHSLSKAELNGCVGELIAWNSEKERWAVELLDAEKHLLVRSANICQAQPVTAEERTRAFKMAEKAETALFNVRERLGCDAADQLRDPRGRAEVVSAMGLLEAARRHDVANAMVAKTMGDCATMLGDAAARVRHFCRAVANGHGMTAADGSRGETNINLLQNRICLAGALGTVGDVEGEAMQLRAVLRHCPGHNIARLSLGQNFLDRDQPEDAIPELMMACQLPPDERFVPRPYAEIIRSQAQHLLLATIGKLAGKKAAQGDHTSAVELLQNALKVPSPSKDDIVRTEANLASSLMALGRLEEAAAAIVRGRAQGATHNSARAWVVCCGAAIVERQADDARVRGDVETSLRLYADAQLDFEAANGICEDPSSRQGFLRVQAKVHPDLEWADAPSTAGQAGAGMARLRPGVTGSVELLTKKLPRGPKMDPPEDSAGTPVVYT